MRKYSHLKLDKKHLRLLAQTTQQLATFSKKALITGTPTEIRVATQRDIKN